MFTKKAVHLIAVLFLALVVSGNGVSGENVTKYASRTIENGTKINLIIGKKIVPAILNESTASQALVAKLPYTVNLQRYSHGYCGVINEKLPYDEEMLHSGWLDGDIVYAKDRNELAILYKDEKISKDLYDGLVTLGVVAVPLSTLESLDRSLSITIALDR